MKKKRESSKEISMLRILTLTRTQFSMIKRRKYFWQRSRTSLGLLFLSFSEERSSSTAKRTQVFMSSCTLWLVLSYKINPLLTLKEPSLKNFFLLRFHFHPSTQE